MKKTIIAYRIEADPEKETITVKKQGQKTPIAKYYTISNYAMSEALRAAAYELLNVADYMRM